MPKKTEVNKANELSKEELDALKESLKKELLVEMKKEEAEKYKAEQEKQKKEAEALRMAQEKTDFKIKTNNKIDKFDRNITQNKTESHVENISSSSNFILIVILLIVIGGIYLLPTIRDAFSKKTKEDNTPIAEKKEEEKEEAKVYAWTDSEVKAITLPIMRNDKNSINSYYQNDKMTISSFSNNDILYNAFINVYSGNIGFHEGGYDGAFCGNDSQRRELNEKYINARVNNLFTKNTEFTHTDFVVPVSSGSSYVGLWRYNPNSHSYIYYGDCSYSSLTEPIYLDVLVENKIETSEDEKTAYLTYGMGFAKVSGNSYEIYGDANYQNLLIGDTFKTNNHEKELHDVLAEFSKDHNLNKYKYTYSTKDCSYSELCYISGEWVHE